jgi:hypothetical protein
VSDLKRWVKDMTLSHLSPVLFVLLAACLASLVFFGKFAIQKRRAACWAAMGIVLVCASGVYATILRLQKDHDELSSMAPQLRTKADLIERFGAPSERTSYDFRGEKIECWIYAVPLLTPRASAQFEFRGDEIFARSHLSP